VDPEGAKAPLPSAAPYYVAEFVVNERLVLARNRFYQGRRPHRVDRIVVDLGADPATAVEQVASGKVEYVWPLSLDLNLELADLARRYGINKARFFLKPSLVGRMSFSIRAGRCS
jgi:ABC-type oligopeptide transport system substrate-binding subunit